MRTAVTASKAWYGAEVTRDMREELQTAMDSSADRIAAQARVLVPVGKGIPKHLRDTIRARSGRKGALGGLLRVAVSKGLDTALPVSYVFAGDRSAGVYWHYFVEYGTYFKSAHPYMRPAMDANFNATLAEAARAGKRSLNKRRRSRAKSRRLAQGKTR